LEYDIGIGFYGGLAFIYLQVEFRPLNSPGKHLSPPLPTAPPTRHPGKFN